MMPPPADYRITDKNTLLRKYEDEGWAEKLSGSKYEYEERPYGFRKTVKIWRSGSDVMAEVREYENASGVSIRVCQLRDGDVHYYTE